MQFADKHIIQVFTSLHLLRLVIVFELHGPSSVSRPAFIICLQQIVVVIIHIKGSLSAYVFVVLLLASGPFLKVHGVYELYQQNLTLSKLKHCLSEELTFAQPIKNFLVFYGTLMFVTFVTECVISSLLGLMCHTTPRHFKCIVPSHPSCDFHWVSLLSS
jgi:hypothetical protein